MAEGNALLSVLADARLAQAGVKVASVEELVAKLKTEAGVL